MAEAERHRKSGRKLKMLLNHLRANESLFSDHFESGHKAYQTCFKCYLLPASLYPRLFVVSFRSHPCESTSGAGFSRVIALKDLI
ncbi:hypothetical protein TNCV_3642311 [Trichonephila clavipes]|nr:hypothetical protein TNCV_3642311 [Trichonephila clavipes]